LTVPDRALWINGRIARGPEAALSLFDRGARDGEGLFETLRVEDGRPHHWRRHLERLVVSAAELGFPVPPSPSVLAAALDEVLAANGLTDAAVRITVTRGIPGGRPTRTGCWVEAEPLAARLWRGTRSGQATAVISRRPFALGTLGRHRDDDRLAATWRARRPVRPAPTRLCWSTPPATSSRDDQQRVRRPRRRS
jgi:branched-subunit amino acid aminotransferase/4-amino-4-deoxychorismate lyase